MSIQHNQAKVKEIQQITGLNATHFSDLIRVAQLIYDPGGGVSGRVFDVDWLTFGISNDVAQNLRRLGKKYQYDLPNIPIDQIWEQLAPETRSWFMANKSILWQIEESFPALDED